MATNPLSVWIRREADDETKAEQVTVPANCTVSGLKAAIVASKVFPIHFVSQITKVTVDGKELPNRSTISPPSEGVTFVISVDESAADPAGPQHYSANFGLGSQRWLKGDQSIQNKPNLPPEKTAAQIPPVAGSEPEKKKTIVSDAFTVTTHQKTEDNYHGLSNLNKTTITVLSKPLKDAIRTETGGTISQLYDSEPRIESYQLLVYFNQLKEKSETMNKDHPLVALVEWLKGEYASVNGSIEAMLKEGFITFGALWYLFPKGTKVYGHDSASNAKVGMEVNTFQYKNTLFSEIFVITGSVLQSNGTRFVSVQKNFVISEFDGAKSIDMLPVRPLDEETHAELSARGKTFVSLGGTTHFMEYTGTIFRKSWWSITYFKADGRVMVDGSAFSRMNPNYRHEDYTGNKISSMGENTHDSVAPQNYFKCWPTVLGFSFTSKKWGEINVNALKPVTFDEKAFTRLVLPTDKKELIKALVANQQRTVSDIISGKGGGCIILLHGKPGVGKTLTAEAIAELLHRPLYSVTVGELGTTAEQLETNLREILEVASVWNAVILLDEADIFLEKRSTNDIIRNAMVGVFLRLLEYHQGVLFLTTNRAKSFDEAFHSRISVALHYVDLDLNARGQIWSTFLEMAGVSKSAGLQLSDLAKHELNGRQIKTTVRLAQALAISKGETLSQDHLLKTIQLTTQFTHDIDAEKERDS